MRLPAEQGISVLYVLADQWLRERQTLTLLGAEDPAPLDELAGQGRGEQRPAGRDRRIELARLMGGEVAG